MRSNALLTLRFFLLLIAFLNASELRAWQQDKRISCGPRVVSIAKRIIDGREIDLTELDRAFHGALDGSNSLEDLADAAKAMGLNAQFVDLNPLNPVLSREPTLVPITRDGIPSSHFVVVFGRNEHIVQMIDYPRPPVFIEFGQFAEVWNGEGIVISASTSRVNAWMSDFPNLFPLVLICVSGHVALVFLSYFVLTFLRRSRTAKTTGSIT